MIGELLLKVLGSLLGWLADLLPEAELPWLDHLEDFGHDLGIHFGPFDRFLPILEMSQFLIIFLGVWMPAVAVYTVVKWVYKHLPLLGKG